MRGLLDPGGAPQIQPGAEGSGGTIRLLRSVDRNRRRPRKTSIHGTLFRRKPTPGLWQLGTKRKGLFERRLRLTLRRTECASNEPARESCGSLRVPSTTHGEISGCLAAQGHAIPAFVAQVSDFQGEQLMLDTAGQWRVSVQPAPSIETHVQGRPTASARERLSQILPANGAIELAAFDLALGRHIEIPRLSRRIRDDHLAQIFVAWPQALGLPPIFDQRWLTDDAVARVALLGAGSRLPQSDFEMAEFLGSDHGVAPLLRLIGDLFGPRTATADDVPFVDAETAFSPAPVENSAAARRAAHPAMSYVESIYGRGPLWRAAGQVIDLALLLSGDVPRPLLTAPGAAVVPAAKGYFALRLSTRDDHITGLSRTAPMDHLLAVSGSLEHMLSRLPADQGALVPLLVTLMDPCRAITIYAVNNT